MQLEVIVQNKQEAIQAEELGADRVELVSAISEGGLTPSYGTIKHVLGSVNIPVQIMIRPHSRHFFYTDEEFHAICDDIQAIQQLGGNRIVFGSLNGDHTVNEAMLSKLFHRFPDIDMTFHRAFDEVVSQVEAYETLSKYKRNVKRILTSGGKASCEEGLEQLIKLVGLARDLQGPSIMPGAGLSSENIKRIKQETGSVAFHFGKAVRINQSFANGFAQEELEKIRFYLE
ncbi:copper homeostasis protein CutC [Oceanobacillus manasiensis]|uniref:copper homeostasis protein CutC n=1 Tax=Oceanobacillus manasiensis TaxID=586413 RepID=UPI0005A8BAFD|nr:copper homeostasis protein CutC [Oceanobacillus manasiensis]